jgi:hypothetical protein
MNSHPFIWIREPSRKILFWLFAGLAVVTLLALQLLGVPLKTEASPAGIVSFELAGDAAKTEGILESWDPTARVYAGLNLGLDFLFIDAYVGAIGLGCVLVGSGLERRSRSLGAAGNYLAWAVVLAGVLDCVENYALIRLLLGSRQAWLAPVAQWCALPKFLIVLGGLVFVAIGSAFTLAAGGHSRREAGG